MSRFCQESTVARSPGRMMVVASASSTIAGPSKEAPAGQPIAVVHRGFDETRSREVRPARSRCRVRCRVVAVRRLLTQPQIGPGAADVDAPVLHFDGQAQVAAAVQLLVDGVEIGFYRFDPGCGQFIVGDGDVDFVNLPDEAHISRTADAHVLGGHAGGAEHIASPDLHLRQGAVDDVPVRPIEQTGV